MHRTFQGKRWLAELTTRGPSRAEIAALMTDAGDAAELRELAAALSGVPARDDAAVVSAIHRAVQDGRVRLPSLAYHEPCR